MIAILIGCAAAFGVVTGGTGGNWQAGLVVAFLTLWGLTSARSAHRRRVEDEVEYVLVRRPEVEERPWWR